MAIHRYNCHLSSYILYSIIIIVVAAAAAAVIIIIIVISSSSCSSISIFSILGRKK